MRIRPLTAAALALCVLSSPLVSADEERPFGLGAKHVDDLATTQPSKVVPGLETKQQKAAYRMGRRDAATYKANGVDREALLRGVRDAMEDTPSPIPQSELDAAATELTNQSIMSIMDRMKKEKEKDQPAPTTAPAGAARAPEKLDPGKQFLEKNRAENGVICTVSGLQFTILKEGSGAPPLASDTVNVHYRGTLLDGTEFDSSYKRNAPASFAVGGVIKGWTEGLQMMKPGSKFKFFIPSDLAYGVGGSPPKIPGNAVLIFEVELISIAGKGKAAPGI